MPFISLGKNLDDVGEDKPVPEAEYDLIVKNVQEMRKSEAGRQMIPVGIQVEHPDYPEAALVWHNIVFPNDDDYADDDQRKATLMLRNIKRFLYIFGVDWTEDGFDSEDLEGAKGRASLGLDEYQGDVRNIIKLPRLKD